MIDLLELAQLEEKRQALGTADVARESAPLAGGMLCFDGPGSWANQACGIGVGAPVTDADLDRLVEFYTTRGAEPRIEVCSFAHDTLIRGLAVRGFEVREFEHVLYRVLAPDDDYRTQHPHGWPSAVELRHVDVRDADQVTRCAEVSTSGFVPVGEPPSEPMLAVARRTVLHPRCDSFMVVVDDLPVGAGGMETRGRIASLFGTSVLPAHRRRGLQAMLILRRLEQARDRGAEIAVIHSRPGIPTERNARRVGFQLGYSKAIYAKPGPGLQPTP